MVEMNIPRRARLFCFAGHHLLLGTRWAGFAEGVFGLLKVVHQNSLCES